MLYSDSKDFASFSQGYTIIPAMLLRLQSVILFFAGIFYFDVKCVQSQTPPGTEIENFRVSEKSLDNKRSTFLTGEKATFLENGLLSLSSPQLVSLTAEGKTNLIFKASKCLYNQDTKNISSNGDLSLATADGQMQLSGLGFSGNLIGPTLTISTNVKAKLKKDLSDVSFRNLPKQGTVDQGQILHISARQFKLIPGQAQFRESVNVVDTAAGILRSDLINVGMRGEDWKIKSIQAIGNVVMENEKIIIGSHEENSIANYDLRTAAILFDGNPYWKMGKRSGKAESIMVDRESMTVSAYGNVKMEIPAGLGDESALFNFNPEPNSSDEQTSLPLYVSSRYFVFQPSRDGQIGYARYIGSVQLKRGDSQLDCQDLNLIFNNNDTGGVKMARAIGIKLLQGKYRLSSYLAIYDFEKNRIVMDMNPSWSFEGQNGRAQRVEIYTKIGKFRADGDVKIELTKVSDIGLLFPLSERKNSSEISTPLFVDCDFFEYSRSSDDAHIDSAYFNESVLLTSKNGFSFSADSINMKINSIKKDLDSIEAIGDLKGSTAGANPMRFTGSQLNYDKEIDVVRLVGQPRVEIKARQDGSEVVAFGTMAHYKVGESELRLVGDPLLRTSKGDLRGGEVIYDQKRNRLRASGNWKMTLNPDSVRKVQK